MKKNFYLSAAFTLTCFLFISCTKEDSLSATDNSSVVASASIDAVNEMDIQTGAQVSFDKLTAKKTGKTLTKQMASQEKEN